MSKAAGSRLLSVLTPPVCAACRTKLLPRPTTIALLRPISTTPHLKADPPSTTDTSALLSSLSSRSSLGSLGSEFSALRPQQRPRAPSSSDSSLSIDMEDIFNKPLDEIPSVLTAGQTPPHHLHIYATKHNTHLTLTRPDRNPLLSFSAGNIGFRKAGRGSYDAAYQLAAFVMKKIQDQGFLREIQKLEVVLRGFGPGREAATKVLLGSEGRLVRGKVVKVTDATRLKFGGTRSPKPRRLG